VRNQFSQGESGVKGQAGRQAGRQDTKARFKVHVAGTFFSVAAAVHRALFSAEASKRKGGSQYPRNTQHGGFGTRERK
jgi:hypothetical protein